AAVSEDVADEALGLIEVEYEELPAVFDPEEALREGAPLLHDPRPEWRPAMAPLVGIPPGTSNLCSHFKLRRGDVERGVAAPDHGFEDTLRLPPVQHRPLQPHGAGAAQPSGKLSVWTASQAPHFVRAGLAEMFPLPLTDVRVVVPTLGGGFGAKGGLRVEHIASLLAWKARRPVKITLRRNEEFVTVSRHRATVRLKTGVDRGGTV